eukprot:617490-Prymnesium_polylepis.1
MTCDIPDWRQSPPAGEPRGYLAYGRYEDTHEPKGGVLGRGLGGSGNPAEQRSTSARRLKPHQALYATRSVARVVLCPH